MFHEGPAVQRGGRHPNRRARAPLWLAVALLGGCLDLGWQNPGGGGVNPSLTHQRPTGGTQGICETFVDSDFMLFALDPALVGHLGLPGTRQALDGEGLRDDLKEIAESVLGPGFEKDSGSHAHEGGMSHGACSFTLEFRSRDGARHLIYSAWDGTDANDIFGAELGFLQATSGDRCALLSITVEAEDNRRELALKVRQQLSGLREAREAIFADLETVFCGELESGDVATYEPAVPGVPKRVTKKASTGKCDWDELSAVDSSELKESPMKVESPGRFATLEKYKNLRINSYRLLPTPAAEPNKSNTKNRADRANVSFGGTKVYREVDRLALAAANAIAADLGVKLRITSGVDRSKKDGRSDHSLHKGGWALDLQYAGAKGATIKTLFDKDHCKMERAILPLLEPVREPAYFQLILEHRKTQRSPVLHLGIMRGDRLACGHAKGSYYEETKGKKYVYRHAGKCD